MLTAGRMWVARAKSKSGPAAMHYMLLALVFVVLSACTRSASRVPQEITTQNAPKVVIDQVQVDQGAGIYVQGHTTLANGECIKTELLANQQSVAWWPRDTCIQVDAGQWEILTALGQNGAPEKLNYGSQYAVRAWWSRQPDQPSERFPIDLNSPTPTQ